MTAFKRRQAKYVKSVGCKILNRMAAMGMPESLLTRLRRQLRVRCGRINSPSPLRNPTL